MSLKARGPVIMNHRVVVVFWGENVVSIKLNMPKFVCHYKQLAAFYNEHMDEMSSWMGMHRYYRRMMQCIVDQIDHQMHVSWYTYQSPGDDDLSIVMNVPLVDDGNNERDVPVGMSSGSLLIMFAKYEMPRLWCSPPLRLLQDVMSQQAVRVIDLSF